jgi:hypothetical protein
MAMVLRRPLTRLELGVVAAGLGIATVIFADRALDVMELAERTAMEATLSNVTSAVNARIAYRVLNGEPASGWEEVNPLDVAGVPSPSQNWSYDADQKELVYHPSLRRHLHTDEPGGPLRFRLIPRRAGLGYQFVPVAGYQWRIVEVLPLDSIQGHCFLDKIKRGRKTVRATKGASDA